jgi:hypothetical protein
MAMAPLLLDWKASSPGFGPNDYYTVHNVNVMNNPTSGEVLLGTVRIPGGAVARAEFVVVMTKVGGKEADFAGHAMLRFVFHEDRRPILLDNHGIPLTSDYHLPDLVVSWEAWRPPRVRFEPVKGLDPETYALTPRLFSGPVRCLSDSILDRPWRCYPLKLPEAPNAADELLYLSLLLGDAVARHTIGGLLDKRIDCGENCPVDYGDFDAEDWEDIKHGIAEQELPEDPIGDLLGGKVQYHLLQSSCITLALLSIDWGIMRIYERLGRPNPPRIKVAPDSLPGFLDKLAQGDRRAALLRAPAALLWLLRNPCVLPGKAEQLLDEAGLLEHDDTGIVMARHDNRSETPYGKLDDHLIY